MISINKIQPKFGALLSVRPLPESFQPNKERPIIEIPASTMYFHHEGLSRKVASAINTKYPESGAQVFHLSTAGGNRSDYPIPNGILIATRGVEEFGDILNESIGLPNVLDALQADTDQPLPEGRIARKMFPTDNPSRFKLRQIALRGHPVIDLGVTFFDARNTRPKALYPILRLPLLPQPGGIQTREVLSQPIMEFFA